MSESRFSFSRRIVVGLGAAAMLAISGIAAPLAAQEPVYKVGSTPTGVPFTFLDVPTNTIQGVMVDVINAIGAEEGFKTDVQATQWSALIPSLTSGKIDIIAAAMYATPKRAEVIDFSNTVYSYGEGMIVPKSDTTAYVKADELAGKTIGVQVGTAYVKPMQDLGVFKDVKIYDTIADTLRDVQLGRIDAGFADKPIIAYQLSKGNFGNVRLVDSYKSTIVGNVAIAVNKGNTELLAKINDGLAKIKASGKLDEILAKWGLN
jgi:polar amino acid transport system substrate-binding protein